MPADDSANSCRIVPPEHVFREGLRYLTNVNVCLTHSTYPPKGKNQCSSGEADLGRGQRAKLKILPEYRHLYEDDDDTAAADLDRSP